MKRYSRPFLMVAVLLLASAMAQPGAAAQVAGISLISQITPAVRYTITDLGTLGGAVSKAYGISDEGQVVGSSYFSGGEHAFLWEEGAMQNLGGLGGDSWAYDINNTSQVVGMSYTSNWKQRAFWWANGTIQDLGTLGGSISYAYRISDAGQVVGEAVVDDEDEIVQAFVWQNGSMLSLGGFAGGNSRANGINNAGHVVGEYSDNLNQGTYAFLWQNGSYQDLGLAFGKANAINNQGQVVGESTEAFLWQDGSIQYLGTLGSGPRSIAYDINDAGLVVGMSYIQAQGTASHAFLWENGQMKDLNTLIPADSGWVLREARAINKRGQIAGWGSINGQTHAFLLTPIAYYWVNASGGAWQTATNWDPQGIPGEGDTTIFDLAGEYTVDAASPPAATGLTANQLTTDRLIVTATATVNFDNLDLNLSYDSPEEPSLAVNGGGTAMVKSGAATFSHAVVGGTASADADNPPTARLQVVNDGTSLTGSGRLTIGDVGVGDLFVANGGHLVSAEARLGGAQPGSAAVGGAGSLWQTGNIAVGFGVSGTLHVENGGRVDSNSAIVGFGNRELASTVAIDFAAPSPGQVSLWALEGNLTIGQSAAGYVDVGNGGQLVVNQNVSILDGMLKVMGHTTTDAPSLLDVTGSVLVGGPNTGVLFLDDGAEGIIDENLVVGQGGPGQVFLVGALDAVSLLKVKNPSFGTCLIGREFSGGVVIAQTSTLDCRNVQLGLAGTGGLGRITVDGGYVGAGEIVRVGQVGSGGGQIELGNGGNIIAGEGLYIAPNGVVTGTGTIFVGVIGVLNEGTLSPGIPIVNAALANDPQHPARTQQGLATMAITGTLTLSPTGRLAIPVAGSSPGQYGSLAVTGAARLDGVLALDFQNGYTPSQGDTFTFLTTTGGVTGAFDDVEISGLPPGFEYEITLDNGQVVLQALNDGSSSQSIFLPTVAR